MAGFRQSPRAAKAARARTVKARAKVFRKNPEILDAEEVRSREKAEKALSTRGDFSATLADREQRYIENRSAFFGKQAQEERLKYLNDTFTAAMDEYNDTGSFVSLVAAVGPTLLMMHRTGGIRNGLSEIWHVNMAEQAKAWAEADPKRFGAFYAQCQAYKDGGRVPYDAHTAALDNVALDARHYEAIRKPGITEAELTEIENRYRKDKADLGAMIELDGVSPRDLVSQQHKLVATLVVKDPKYATMYGICPGSKEYEEAVAATGAKFGPKGQSAPPVEMHAADSELGWPAGKYMQPKGVKDLAYYQETMRTGVAAFEPGDGKAKGAGDAARAAYWTSRMVSDGISKDKAKEAVAAASEGKPKVPEERTSRPKAIFAGFRERLVTGIAAVRERFQPKYPSMSAVKGKTEPDYMKIGDETVDLTTGKRAPKGTEGMAPEDRDWVKKGGLREYLAATEARLNTAERKDIMVRELRRFQESKDPEMTAAQAMEFYGSEAGRDRLVRDGMLQDLREKLPEDQKAAMPKSFAHGDGYQVLLDGMKDWSVSRMVETAKSYGQRMMSVGSKAFSDAREKAGAATERMLAEVEAGTFNQDDVGYKDREAAMAV